MRVSPLFLALACSCVGADVVDRVESGEGEGEFVGGEGEFVVGEGEAVDGEGEFAGEGEGESVVVGEGEGDAIDGCGAADFSGCSVDADGDQRCVVSFGGRDREFIVHVGATVDAAPAPLVLAFHGLSINASAQRRLSHLNDTADDQGFVVVYPEGVANSFNAGLCCGTAESQGVDDVGFSVFIVDWMKEHLCIDTNRVYATGLSNGGHMAYALACDEADVFAAVASVAGVVARVSCTPSRPIPVLHVHGTADRIVGYDLGISGRGAELTVADWVEDNECSDEEVEVYNQGEVVCRAHQQCSGDAEVEFCRVEGGGHQWPGGADLPLLGHNSDDLDASAFIAAFFLRHRLSD